MEWEADIPCATTHVAVLILTQEVVRQRYLRKSDKCCKFLVILDIFYLLRFLWVHGGPCFPKRISVVHILLNVDWCKIESGPDFPVIILQNKYSDLYSKGCLNF